MEKNSTQNIALDRIDTSVAVENFVILLKENKTFFLNGAWGSGKTDFLVNVSEKSKKKIVTIDFWKINDNRTSIEIVFSRLRPIIYFIIRAIAVFAVVVSILMSNVIDLGLSHYISDSFFKIFVTIIVLCVAAHQFFKPKSDIFYANILANFSFSKKVLVIDDFDRLSSSRQEEIYKLFSLLNGQLPIVFVGDINKINKVKDNYLSKIIDRRIELPFSLHPNEIWNDYFLKLEATFGVTLSDHFKRLLKSEGRNLRDRVHFNDYVNQEFFLQGKSGHVQVEQQLLVIYAYLFHPKLYKGLLDDELIEYTLSDEQKSELKYNGEPTIPDNELIWYLLNQLQNKENVYYPNCFSKDRSAYLLFEQTSNTSIEDLEKVFQDNTKLESALFLPKNTDFYQYFIANYSSFEDSKKSLLVAISLKYIKENQSSDAISYIIREKEYEIMPPKKFAGASGTTLIYDIPKERANKTEAQIDNIIFMCWNKLLDQFDFDLSQKIYFFVKYHIFSFHKLGERFTNLSVLSRNFKQAKRKDFIVLTYISSNDLWNKFSKWDESLWSALNSLNDHEFVSFWILQNIISNGKDYEDFDFRPDDKIYTLWVGRYKFENGEKISYEDSVIKKIEGRIEQLESQGYRFSRRIDEKHKRDY